MFDVFVLLLGVALTFGTSIFVSAEFSLVALDSASIKSKAQQGNKSARSALRALQNLSTQLSGAQVGITLTTILLGYTTQTVLTRLLTTTLDNAGTATALAASIAVILSAILVNLFSMIFGELVPKNLALAHPLKVSGIVTPSLLAFTKVFKPIIVGLNGVANQILHILRITPQEEISSARSAAELAFLVRHSAAEGALDETTAFIFTKSIHLNELNAQDVMVDRGRVFTLSEKATAKDVVELARETGHSRFPVLKENTEQVLGLVSLRGVMSVPQENRGSVSVRSKSLLNPAPLVPGTNAAGSLLVQLRDDGLQMAIVVDEYGGLSGIVTLEDLIEEIVGDVSDEHDKRRMGIRRHPSGAWLLPGELRPDELKDRTGIALPEDNRYETLGGLIMTLLGRIPKINDSVETAGCTLTVTQMSRRRITQISLLPPENPQEYATPRDET